MGKLRVAVIGVGYLGKFHAEKYAGMDDVKLVGVADVDPCVAGEIAEKLNVKPYTDYRELVGRVDAVSVVVPTRSHFEVAGAFLANGVDVMLEKPMTSTLEEADRLIEMAEARDLVLQVGHLERFNPAIVPIKNMVKDPVFIESHRLSIYKPRGTDVSVVLDLMIHDIDLILNFVRSEVSDIRAAGIDVISDSVDIANARLEFKCGCVANVTASRISTRNERKLRMFQKDAYMAFDFAKRGITIIDKSEGGDDSGLIPGLTIRELLFAEGGDPLEQELRGFVRSVINREKPDVSGREGREALRVALAVMEQISKTRAGFGK